MFFIIILDDSGDEKAAQAVKKEKKAKRSLIKDYNREEDNFNREASSRVLEVLEKVNVQRTAEINALYKLHLMS